MSSLPAPLRRQLERTALEARNIAEAGARKSLEALAVHEPDLYRHMDEAQRKHRVKLRAQAKQLGDGESHTKPGAYEIKHLVEKTAYDQWHRLLFARFLIENNLLISPEHGVSVTLDDCEELAPSLGIKDAWTVAAKFAAKELPEIFRADDPAGAVELPVEDRKQLIQLVKGLPVEVFTASDSLGWCYQFWQAQRKEEINKSEVPRGADEIPAVTQLFTEDYMVDFLLDNTLGAWWAGKQLAIGDGLSAIESEEAARQAVSLPGCPWNYLRFIAPVGRVALPGGPNPVPQPSTINPQPSWQPAAGSFVGWPKTAKELKCLDPSMGSGHFIVAMFERLVPLRMAEEKLEEPAAVEAVIRDNLFGLEIDPRCTQIAAFNLALAAWRRVGHCPLPAMNLACSGLAPNTKATEWLKIVAAASSRSPSILPKNPEQERLEAAATMRLTAGMEQLYKLFQNAPVLGSLINPRAAEGDLLVADYHELQPLLDKAMAQESKDDNSHELAVTAQGVAKAAEILARQFTLVATNVPYLGRGKQNEILQDYCERVHPDAKPDLATCFVERCSEFCLTGGSTALVTPQNWLFLASYKKLRQKLLTDTSWSFALKLGAGAFETISGEVVQASLVALSRRSPEALEVFMAQDVSSGAQISDKAEALRSSHFHLLSQIDQRTNPDSVVTAEPLRKGALLADFAQGIEGLSTGDKDRFLAFFWEIVNKHAPSIWEPFQAPASGEVDYDGFRFVVRWENGHGALVASEGARVQGHAAWGKRGVLIGRITSDSASLTCGFKHDKMTVAIVPRDPLHLPAIWAFCSSSEFSIELRKLTQRLDAATGTLVKVPFDLAHWQKVAAEKYPHGLPKPFSSDPTQWLFSGHPKGSDQPLQVAVARLLCYQWPRQTGSSFPDCPALSPDGLEKLADDDGIVCLSATKGEAPAHERLRSLLAAAYGKEWSVAKQEELLSTLNNQPSTLEDWLRNGFFEQHCALFHNRPFIWHIWDGHKNGFNALVNYHLLTHANLEKLTYAYLGDWIRRQQTAVEAGEAGSDARLQAAKQLQSTLKLILEGEPPYDIFVRWKGLASQAIGWNPDINDGVRMNIRPFAEADILRKRVKIKWDKDRGKEPHRDKKDYPWFWHGPTFTGDRLNDIHLTKEQKEKAKK